MLLLLLLSAMILESWADSRQCDRTPSLKFSVSSWKNETGHRLVASDESDKDSVSLTVELFSEECGDARAVILKTLISSGHPEEEETVTTTVAPKVVPLPGYRHFPGYGYYKILPNRMSWPDGVQACRREGAHMWLVESQEEIEALYQWTGCCTWIGVYRASYFAPWINILGLTGWLPNNPIGQGDCIVLDVLKSPVGITNNDCRLLWKVVCEQSS